VDAAELLTSYARIWRSDDGTLEAHERLFARLLAQPDAEQVLLEAIESARSADTRSVLLGRLGLAHGADGVGVLRSYATASGPGSRDVRGAALAGLSNRLGAGATPDLRAALHHRDSWTRVNAMDGLLRVGDSSAWEDAFAVWSGWVKSGRSLWDDPEASVALPLLYLLRDADPGSDRVRQLVETIRARVPVIDRAWYERFWRDALPDGPSISDVPLPDWERVLRWYLVTYHQYPQHPSTGLRFRVQYSHQLHGNGPFAVGDVLAGGPDVWQDDRKRLVSVGGRRAQSYVSIGSTIVGSREYWTLSMPYARDVSFAPGVVIELLD